MKEIIWVVSTADELGKGANLGEHYEHQRGGKSKVEISEKLTRACLQKESPLRNKKVQMEGGMKRQIMEDIERVMHCLGTCSSMWYVSSGSHLATPVILNFRTR